MNAVGWGTCCPSQGGATAFGPPPSPGQDLGPLVKDGHHERRPPVIVPAIHRRLRAGRGRPFGPPPGTTNAPRQPYGGSQKRRWEQAPTHADTCAHMPVRLNILNY